MPYKSQAVKVPIMSGMKKAMTFSKVLTCQIGKQNIYKKLCISNALVFNLSPAK